MSHVEFNPRENSPREKDFGRAIHFLNLSIESLNGRLEDDRDWRRCFRLIKRAVPHLIYEWSLLPLLPYSEYLLTKHWQDTRARALHRAKFKCQVCNAGGELHTHHRSYEHLGNEQDADLIVLCAGCHQLFHDKRKLAEE